ncbi:MAG TPA: penicillin-binding transpeptidase domain-containing protein, partial [Clostridia bacterium]|nr:penicillin-binding transpeptidase domain-containing protein [Clostridia bacterium]
MKEKLNDRYNILAMFFIAIGIAILLGLVNIQILNGKKNDEASQKALLNVKQVKAPRGNIYDKNGMPIALNRIGFTVEVMDAGLNDDELNNMLYRLIKLFEKNGDSYDTDFEKFFTYENGRIEFGSIMKRADNKAERLANELGLSLRRLEGRKTAQDFFKYLREIRYEISSKYSIEDAYKILCLRYDLYGFSLLKSVRIARDVSKTTVAELEEMHQEFPGVTTDVEYLRKYVNALYEAHVVGYLRAISPEKYDKLKDDGYKMDDLIGVSGIEVAAEKQLKGIDGYKKVETDLAGRMTKELNEQPAIPGDNVYLTLDTKLQKVAMDSLAKNISFIKNKKIIGQNIYTNVPQNKGDAAGGAFVAIDVTNGDVLAMGSYPTYDPSIFLAGSDNKAAQKAIYDLFNSDTKPEINRAIAGTYAPGSTYKPLVSIAGLEQGVINRNTPILDEGEITKEGVELKCLEYANGQGAHGWIPLRTGLATSCNMFFYKLGNMIGIDNVDKWAKNFGLGERTGIELYGEYKGIRSNKETFAKANNGVGKFGYVYTAKSCIGQMYNSFTPLQLANYTATIANGGKHFTPHLIKRIISSDGTVVDTSKTTYTQIKLRPETMAAVKEGMVAVANSNDGTAVGTFKDFTSKYNITVAAKTGTAETRRDSTKSNNGVFICYAPADKPKIAIAIVIEKGVYGAFAAPIARDMLMEYFHLNETKTV